MTQIQPSRFESFDLAYKTVLGQVYNCGLASRPRGLEIRELTNVVFTAPATNCLLDFTSTEAHERQPVWKAYVQKELEWYLSGNDDAQSAPAKFWHSLADKDGKINSNYGKMILHDKKYPGDLTAFESAVSILSRDPDSRQAVLFYSGPAYYTDGCKDVPCTIAAQVLIRDGAAHMSIYQRSCDVILGIVYDFPWGSFLLEKLANALGVKTGNVTHFSGSLHLYEKNFDLARRILTPRDARS
jgi:thymidylate synthase